MLGSSERHYRLQPNQGHTVVRHTGFAGGCTREAQLRVCMYGVCCVCVCECVVRHYDPLTQHASPVESVGPTSEWEIITRINCAILLSKVLLTCWSPCSHDGYFLPTGWLYSLFTIYSIWQVSKLLTVWVTCPQAFWSTGEPVQVLDVTVQRRGKVTGNYACHHHHVYCWVSTRFLVNITILISSAWLAKTAW